MKVVIVGAGYAGTIAANRLARRLDDAQITVVNPRPLFVERVRLHEQLSGHANAATDLSRMLHTGISTRVGTALKVNAGAVTLNDGGELEYDYAIVAVGSRSEPLPGAIAMTTWDAAEQARGAVETLGAGCTVTVIGSGLTGIESAAELAESRPDLNVRVVGTQLGPSLSNGARARVRKGLEHLGVEVVTGKVRAVAQTAGPQTQPVTLESGEELPSDLSLWAVVSGVPDLVYDSNLRVNDEGRAVVDDFLRSVDDQRIFVVGDCAAVPGARMACATAAPQGAHAADTLIRMVSGREPKRYSMGYVGQAVSLGRHDGVIQMVRRDDSPRDLHISGRSAAFVKERICRYAKRGTRTAVYSWVKAGRGQSGARSAEQVAEQTGCPQPQLPDK